MIWNAYNNGISAERTNCRRIQLWFCSCQVMRNIEKKWTPPYLFFVRIYGSFSVSCQLPCFGFTSCQATSRHLTCFKTDLMDNWPLLISYLMLSDLLPSLPFWPLTFWQLAFIHKWPFWQITFSQFTCLDVLPFDSLPVLSIYLFDN